MSGIIEYVGGVVESIASNILALATVVLLAGLFFISLGFLQLDGTSIISRDSTNVAPLIIGSVLSFVGFLLFVIVYFTGSTRRAKSIVFYTPTIKANSFFMELLDYSVERAKRKGYRFVIEKGDLEQFHAATNYLDIIKQYSGRNAANTVLMMIPPSPATYEQIWKLPKELKVNLLTLDMDIEGHEDEYEKCPFHKRVILVDNRYGAMLAAKEIASFCETEGIEAINVIICEGNFHARGRLFKSELEKFARGSSLEINFLGPFEELSFSDAIKKARRYVQYVLRDAAEELTEKNTFIFCANDNLAIGARMEVSQISPGAEKRFQPIRIICFDASTFVKMHIELGDRFFWRAIDQRYTEIVRQAIESAENLLEGQKLTKEPIRVKPEVFGRFPQER
jgi:DNA-binding LacI/PurR family transcriptional regulator